MAAYNPLSYHNGSVWPHDNAIVAAGLMRYGFVERRAPGDRAALLDAAAAFGGRLPELFSGLRPRRVRRAGRLPDVVLAAGVGRGVAAAVRAHPAAASTRGCPRASSGSPPALPPEIEQLRLERIPLMGGRVTVEVDGVEVKVEGLPPDIELLDAPRAPLTSR